MAQRDLGPLRAANNLGRLLDAVQRARDALTNPNLVSGGYVDIPIGGVVTPLTVSELDSALAAAEARLNAALDAALAALTAQPAAPIRP